MSQQELLKRVVDVLNDAGIAYMVTGSVASSVQGEPRATHDVDLVVEIRPEDAIVLARDFPPPNFYLDESAIRKALTVSGMFNLLDTIGGDKVDFWILKDEPFDRQAFQRRYVETVAGISLFMSQPEDTILSKLRWAEISGGSEKQFNDALRIYEVQFGRLDEQHIENWARQLNVTALWQRVKDEADVP